MSFFSRNRWLLTLSLLIAAFGGILVWRQAMSSVRNGALELAKSGRFDEAAPALRRCAEKSDSDAEVLQALAAGYSAAGLKDEAETFAKKWRDVSPRDVAPYSLHLKLMEEQNRWPEAIQDAEKLLELEPSNEKLRRKLAGYRFSAGDLDGAEADCRGLLQHTPQDRGILILLAQIARSRNKLKESGDLLDQVLATAPGNFTAIVARANVHMDAGEADKAVPLLRKAIAGNFSQQKSVRYQLSLALQRAGNEAEANQLTDELRKLQNAELLEADRLGHPASEDIQIRAAKAFMETNNAKHAASILENYLGTAPQSKAAHRVLADAYRKMGRIDLAARHEAMAAPSPDNHR